MIKAKRQLSRPELIPKEILFGDFVKVAPLISPDGTRLAYLAPADGVGFFGSDVSGGMEVMARFICILFVVLAVAGLVYAQETPKTPPNSQAQKDAVRENWDSLQSAWNAIDDWKTGPARGPENAAEMEKTLLDLAARTAKSLSEAGLGGNDLKPFEARVGRQDWSN